MTSSARAYSPVEEQLTLADALTFLADEVGELRLSAETSLVGGIFYTAEIDWEGDGAKGTYIGYGDTPEAAIRDLVATVDAADREAMTERAPAVTP